MKTRRPPPRPPDARALQWLVDRVTRRDAHGALPTGFEDVVAVAAQPRAQRSAPAVHTARVEHAAQIHAAAEAGQRSPGGPLPHLEAIQRSFGRHDVSGVIAHGGGSAGTSARAMGALAYTRGDHVVFAQSPSLHTAAHEAAHVVQQRSGLQLADGIGRTGDRHEQHANAVADRVVAGQSTEALLAQYQPPSAPAAESAVQRKCMCGTGSDTPCPACADEADRPAHEPSAAAVQRKDDDAKPQATCPGGGTRFSRATWLHCDEGGAGTRDLGCSVCADTGERQNRCTTVTAAIGTNIVAPNIGACGDEFEIQAFGGKRTVKVVKAEIPGGTELDIHTDVIAALGLPLETGHYDVCLRPLGSKDPRVVRSGPSKCTPPAGNKPPSEKPAGGK